MNRRSFLVTSAAAGLAQFSMAAEPPRVRIAMIGTAHSHAAGKMGSIRALPELLDVAGVAEPDATRRAAAEKLASFSNLKWLGEDELLADKSVRAFAIETDISEAPAAALRAIRAGKHLHLDKPGALAHPEFKALRTEAGKRGVTVQMGYMLRYNPAIALLFQVVRDGWLGEITEIDAAMGKLADDRQRAVLKEYPGSGMFELGCHLVDTIVTLVGKPAAVHAFSSSTRAPADDLTDNQIAILEYPKLAATLRCNHVDPHGAPRRRLSVAGTKGSMEIEPLESGKGLLRLTEPRGMFQKGENQISVQLPSTRYEGEFRDLARVINDEKQFAWDAAHDIAVHETALRAAGAWKG